MTSNEQSMLFEIARGLAALGRAVEILAEQLPESEARTNVVKAGDEAEASLREFIRLVDEEWLADDE